MGQQPSTAGKTRKKPRKVSTAAEAAQSAASLYDDDEEEKTVTTTKPQPSPTDSKRQLSTPKDTNLLPLVPAPLPSPKKPSPPSSPRKGEPSPSPPSPKAPPAAAAVPQPFVADSANPFCGPLDHVREEERPFQHLASISHFDVPTLRKLHSIFTDISSSSTDDGIIDAAELTEAMGLPTDCLLARAIFRIFDITQTKRINFRTWVTTLSALSPFASLDEKIRFSFSLYDVNSDGSIDINELRSLLAAAVRENVLDLTEQQVRQVCDHTLQNVDRDGNGMVEYDEYRQVVMGSRKFMESFTLDVGSLLESFRIKKGREVTDEEARIRMTRFRGKDRGAAGAGRKDAKATAAGDADTPEDDGSEEERKDREERNEKADAGKEETKGNGRTHPHDRGSDSLTSSDPAARAIQALHDV